MGWEPRDLEALTAPIDGGAGEDLRVAADSGTYLALKDARSDARDAERRALEAEDAEQPPLEAGLRSWGLVAELAEAALAARSKDLEIAGWLTEAWTRLDGFAGLADGLTLMKALLDGFWEDGLWPPEEDDGAEDRLAPLFGLAGRTGVGLLVQPVRMLPLADAGDPPPALWTWELVQAPLARPEDPEARERLQSRHVEQVEGFDQAIRRSSPAFLRSTYAAVVAAQDALEALVSRADTLADVGRFGSQVATPLQAIRGLLESRVGHILVEAGPEVDAATGAAGDAAAAPSRSGGGGLVSDRREAFAQVLRVADFFDRTEPQALIGRSLREVVRRARLSLDELLAELLPAEEARIDFLLRAGVRAPDADGDDSYSQPEED